MPKKIDPNIKCCEKWEKKRTTPLDMEIGASCKWNLYAHCWIMNKDDPVVKAALSGDPDCVKILHSRIKHKERTQ